MVNDGLTSTVTADSVFKRSGLPVRMKKCVKTKAGARFCFHQNRKGSSVPNPKFAISAASTGANFGSKRTLEIYDSSVVLVQKFS
jgi:hypothetical protein